MKKTSHEERIRKSKEAIEKTKLRQRRTLSPRGRRILNNSMLISATAGIVASVGVGAYLAATQDKEEKYPISSSRFTSSDFIANLKDKKPKITIKTNGNQQVITATQGPVKFISNYVEMFNSEKMKDWTQWFYHDVSWGPEISTLSSINFLSGVQSEDGQVTLGYHTTNREGSTIIMSPDVTFGNNKDIHTNESMVWALTHDGDKFDSKLAKFFAGKDVKKDETMWVKEAAKSDAFLYINRIILKSYHAVKKYGTDVLSQIKSKYMSKYKTKQAEWNDPRNQDKLGAARILGGDFVYIPYDIALSLLDSPFFQSLYYKPAFDQSYLKLDRKTDKEKITDDIFNTIYYVEGLDDPTLNFIVPALYNSSTNYEDPTYYHMLTQAEIAKWAIKKVDITSLFKNLLLTAKPSKYKDKKDVISAIASVLYFYFQSNGAMARKIAGKKTTFATAVFSKIIKNALELTNAEIVKKYDGKYLSDLIFGDKGPIGDYTSEDIKGLIKTKRSVSLRMTGLSRRLQNKYHSAQVINGKRVSGIPVYKDGDSFYDSIVRRIMQDMMYTVSHEYGHHTTLFYASDLSGYSEPKDIKKNGEATDITKSPAAVYSSEVLVKPTLDSIVSGFKYTLFRNAFSSSYFKDVLDKTSDGDPRTDVPANSFSARNIFGNSGKEISVTSDDFGIEGLDLSEHTLKPMYFGHSLETGFGISDANGLVSRLLELTSKEQQRSKPLEKTDFAYSYMNLIRYLANFGNKNSFKTKESLMKKIKSLIANPDIWGYGSDYTTQNDDGTLGDYTPDSLASSNSIFGLLMSPAFLGDIEEDLQDSFTDLAETVSQSEQTDMSNSKPFAEHLLSVNPESFHNVYSTIKTVGWGDYENSFIKDFALRGYNILQYAQSVAENPQDYGFPAGTKSFGTTYWDLLNQIEKDIVFADGSWKPRNDILELVGTNNDDYIWPIVVGAQEEFHKLKKEHGTNYSHWNRMSGNFVTDALYKKIGEDTKTVFEAIYDYTYDSPITINGEDIGNWTSIDKKFYGYHVIYQLIYDAFYTTDSIADAFSYIENSTDRVVEYNGEEVKVTIPLQFSDFMILPLMGGEMVDADHWNPPAHGFALYEMAANQKSAEAAVYVFNTDDDTKRYKTTFTTKRAGNSPPSSFLRYTSTYAESLTRAWNQIAYVVEAELLSEPGEYYNGDQARFESYGETFYNTGFGDEKGHEKDRTITQEGKKIKDMYAKFFNTDKLISAMVRNRATGLYTMFGYDDTSNAKDDKKKIKAVVFVGKDGKKHVAQVSYGVDNFHYYTKHGDASSGRSLHEGKTSWMIDYQVMGNFSNSLLRSGEYRVKIWRDTNGDKKMQESELISVKNSDIQLGGKLNSNGKIKDTAELMGNPELTGKNDDWVLKVNVIKI